MVGESNRAPHLRRPCTPNRHIIENPGVGVTKLMLDDCVFPGCAPGLPVRGLIGNRLLAPQLKRIEHYFDRLASKSAKEEGIFPDNPANPDLYALWGCTSDGQVLGLQRVGSCWRMTLVPIPSNLVRLLHLPGVLEAQAKLAWIQIRPNRINCVRHGQLIPVWEAENSVSLQPEPKLKHLAKPSSILFD